ncbi:hypothetical protein LZ31DRAFT_483691 [Colletotrichum somersetense]|nr:hypothetical protein LZ31DRAFT_483691 [Colletotrichum somersetense]
MTCVMYNESDFTESPSVRPLEKEVYPGPVAPKSKRHSFRKRLKKVLHNIGHPPTYQYDLKNGIETQKTAPVGIMGSNILAQPSRL